MSVLDVLARASVTSGPETFAARVRDERVKLPWGATLVAITGQASEGLLHELIQARRGGLNSALIVCGRYTAGFHRLQARAARFGIPAHHVLPQRDWNVRLDG
jgi:hypothetical protein